MSNVKVVSIEGYKVVGLYNWPSDWRQSIFLGNPPIEYSELDGEDVDLPITVGWKYEGGEFLPPDEVLVDYGTKITKLAFLNRLGDTVLAAIEAASRVANPLGYAAAVIKIKHASSTYIDLSLPETQSDVQKLVDYGFIDAAKRLEILNTPVTEKEVPLFLNGNIY